MTETTVDKNGIPSHWDYISEPRPESIDKVVDPKSPWITWALGEYIGETPEGMTDRQVAFAKKMRENHYLESSFEEVLKGEYLIFPALEKFPREVQALYVDSRFLNISLRAIKMFFANIPPFAVKKK